MILKVLDPSLIVHVIRIMMRITIVRESIKNYQILFPKEPEIKEPVHKWANTILL